MYLGWTVAASGLTLLAWILEVIPESFVDLPMAPFFILTDHKFVVMLAIPYLFILGVVFSSDMIALLIALMRRARMTTPAFVTSTASTSEMKGVIRTTSSCASNGKGMH